MPVHDDPRSGQQLEDLMVDLQRLVDAGLLIEVRRPGEPSRYALSERGEDLAAPRGATRLQPSVRLVMGRADGGYEPPPAWPEPCPACGAEIGYDGGSRCLRCYVASPPEMS